MLLMHFVCFRPPIVRVSDKVMIPQEEHPDINFVGLLIGPRGNTLKNLEKEVSYCGAELGVCLSVCLPLSLSLSLFLSLSLSLTHAQYLPPSHFSP